MNEDTSNFIDWMIQSKFNDPSCDVNVFSPILAIPSPKYRLPKAKSTLSGIFQSHSISLICHAHFLRHTTLTRSERKSVKTACVAPISSAPRAMEPSRLSNANLKQRRKRISGQSVMGPYLDF